MCDKCNKNDLGLTDVGHDRRKLLKEGAALAAAPLLAGFASNVLAAQGDKAVGAGPYPCAARNIKADVELIKPNQINEAFARVVNKNILYRFVIDMTA